MDREDLQLFMTILGEDNLIKAAELLYMSPSTTGSRLRAMEEELGFEPFERKRGTKTALPILESQKFSRFSAQMLALWNEADRIRHHCELPFLTITTVGNSLDRNLTPLYRELASTHGLSLNVKCYPVGMIYSLVSSKQADISFAFYHTNCPHVDMVPIMEDDMVLVVSKGQSASRKSSKSHAPVHLSSLASDRELLTGSRFNSSMGQELGFRLWHDRYISPQTRSLVAVSSISTLTGFLEAGDYWTIIPSATANGPKEQHPISILPLSSPPPGRILYIPTHEPLSRVSSGNMELFTRCFRGCLKMHNSEGCLME